jgi:membrane protein YdbS with pleckstrin-like domain
MDDNPSTGPIPIAADDAAAEDLDTTPKESALAWLRFCGELIIALAAGVGIYFLFTVIWEMLPYLAVLVAPLAVTGLVAGVSAYRHKVQRDPVGPKLLAVLVFAGTLLTVAPAAGLLASG